jgi:hypothetical protein
MRIIILLIGTVLLTVSRANGQQPEMADAMRADGKIYVVVSIISLAVAGLLVYIGFLDKKISRIEKDQKK